MRNNSKIQDYFFIIFIKKNLNNLYYNRVLLENQVVKKPPSRRFLLFKHIFYLNISFTTAGMPLANSIIDKAIIVQRIICLACAIAATFPCFVISKNAA